MKASNLPMLGVQLREAAQMIVESGNYPDIQLQWAEWARHIVNKILSEVQDRATEGEDENEQG